MRTPCELRFGYFIDRNISPAEAEHAKLKIRALLYVSRLPAPKLNNTMYEEAVLVEDENLKSLESMVAPKGLHNAERGRFGKYMLQIKKHTSIQHGSKNTVLPGSSKLLPSSRTQRKKHQDLICHQHIYLARISLLSASTNAI